MAAKKTNKKVVKKATSATGKEATKPVAAPKKAAPTKAESTLIRTPFVSGDKAGIAADLSRRERLAQLKSIAKKINTQFKSDVVVTADEAHTNTYLRRPCGIMQLDIDTGGGMPAGRLVTLTGPNQAGKTTLLYYYYAMHQRLYGEDAVIAHLCSEGNVDHKQARAAGWIIPTPWKEIQAQNQEREKLGIPAFTDEEIAELRRGIGHNHLVEGLGTCEEFLDVAHDLLKSNLYGLIGLDSYEGLMPSAEAQLESLESFPTQAARASLIGRFMQHYGPITRDPAHFTTFIMTCQVRNNRKKNEAPAHFAKYMKEWASVVPDSVKHWRKIDVTVWSGAKIGNGKKDKEDKEVFGKYINWDIVKGTLNAHDNVQGETAFYYDKRGFNLLQTVFDAGFKYGVIREKEGRLTFLPNGEPDDYLDGVPSPEEFIRAMSEDQEKEMQVRRAILHAAGKPCVYV